MRTEIDLGKHGGAFEDGVLETRLQGDVDEAEARKLQAMASDWSTGAHIVWVSDVTRLGNFSAAARKVLSAPAPGMDSTQEMHTYLFVVGAGIRAKAVLSLVFAATRLLGTLRYHVVYVDGLEEARRLAHEKLRSLVAAGLAKLPGA